MAMEASDVHEVEVYDAEDFVKSNVFETENFFCDVYCFEEGQTQEPHVHDGCDKVYQVLEGVVKVSVGDESMVLEDGGAVLASAGERHGVEAVERSRLLVYMSPHPAYQENDCGHDDVAYDAHGFEERSLDFGFVTVSSSREEEEDASGARAKEMIEDAGHSVEDYRVVGDDAGEITEAVESCLDGCDLVVTSGGTGLTDDDVTAETLRELFDREVTGFGEEFRRRSVEDVGTAGMLSDATAGVVDDSLVFVLPGSVGAVETGLSLALPEAGHMVGLVGRER